MVSHSHTNRLAAGKYHAGEWFGDGGFFCGHEHGQVSEYPRPVHAGLDALQLHVGHGSSTRGISTDIGRVLKIETRVVFRYPADIG